LHSFVLREQIAEFSTERFISDIRLEMRNVWGEPKKGKTLNAKLPLNVLDRWAYKKLKVSWHKVFQNGTTRMDNHVLT
jgi:hypothetical protein